MNVSEPDRVATFTFKLDENILFCLLVKAIFLQILILFFFKPYIIFRLLTVNLFVPFTYIYIFNSALCMYLLLLLLNYFKIHFSFSIRQIPFYLLSYFLRKTSLAKIGQVSCYPRSDSNKF